MFASARIHPPVDPTIHRLSRGGPPVRLMDELATQMSKTKRRRNELFKMYDRAATSLGIRAEPQDSLTELSAQYSNDGGRGRRRSEAPNKAAQQEQDYHVHPPSTTGYIPPMCRRKGRSVYEQKFYIDRLTGNE